MSEYRKLVNVHPIILYKEDLFEFENLLASKDLVCKITVTSNDVYLTAETFSDLFNNNTLPLKAETMTVEAHYWKENDIYQGIHFCFYNNYIDYQIFSKDKTWFYGQMHLLNDFFKKRKPRILFLAKTKLILLALGFSFPLSVTALIKAIEILRSNSPFQFKLVFPIILTLFLAFLAYLDHKLFSYCQINFCSKTEKRVTIKDNLSTSANIATIIGIGLGFITLLLTILALY